MPRYFLHIEHVGRPPVSDEEGATFDDLDAAIAEAEEGLRELLAAAIRDASAPVPYRIQIIDEDGLEVAALLARDYIPQQLR